MLGKSSSFFRSQLFLPHGSSQKKFFPYSLVAVKNSISHLLMGAPVWKYYESSPTILGAENQLTKFSRNTSQPDLKPVEKGDHLLIKIDSINWFVWNMTMLMRIRSDGTYNNGLKQIETIEAYYLRVMGEQIPLLLRAMQSNKTFLGATIAEGVIDEGHLNEFKAMVSIHLPDCQYVGPTAFGLGMLVRKNNPHQEFKIDESFSKRMNNKQLNSRCIAVIESNNPKHKKIAIHTPHGKKGERNKERNYYSQIIRHIYLDMLGELKPLSSDNVNLETYHIHAGKEHMKCSGEIHGVSGATIFKLSSGNKRTEVIRYEITGDFNLSLCARQDIDKAVFSRVKKEYYYSTIKPEKVIMSTMNLLTLLYILGFIYSMHQGFADMEEDRMAKTLVAMSPSI